MITQISYEFRDYMLQGTQEFKDSLKQHYNVNARPIWMPQSGGNFEMWFDIFFDSTIIDFLRDAVIGATFEFARNKYFKPFLDSLVQLETANEYGLEIQKYRFFFEDTKVVVYGLTTNFTSIFSEIFSTLFKQYELIANSYPEHKINNLSEIRIPVDKESGRNEWWTGPEEIQPYLTYWGISVDMGLDNFIWDVQAKKLVERN